MGQASGAAEPAGCALPASKGVLYASKGELLAVLGFLFLAVLNPFGMRSASEAESRDVFLSFMAPLYPTDARDKIAVVLVDDWTLEEIGRQRGQGGKLPFPPPFPFYTRLIDVIASHRPKAIFLDFLFLDERGDPAGLAALAGKIKEISTERKIPILLPISIRQFTTNGPTLDERQSLFQLRDAATQGVHVVVGEHGASLRPVIWAPNPANRYDSAALALYRILGDSTAMSEKRRREFVNTLTIRWSDSSPPDNARIYQQAFQAGCGARTENSVRRFMARLWWEFQQSEDNVEALQEARNCPPFLTIPAALLYDPDRLAALLTTTSQPDPGKVGQAIAGRAVLIGGQFSGVNDYIASPVHGNIPGVFAQAMALDNLLNEDRTYLRPWPRCWIGLDDLAEALLLVVFALLSGRWSLRRDAIRMRGFGKVLSYGLLYCAFGFSLQLFVLAGGFWLGHFEPVNWIALLATGAILFTPIFKDVAAAAFGAMRAYWAGWEGAS